MAIASSKRRVVSAKTEVVRGTAENPLPQNDGIPLLRGRPAFTIQPIQVERDTLRLSYTEYQDIYPGKSTCEMVIAVEIGGRDAGFPTTIAHWTRLLNACAMQAYIDTTNIFAYKVSGLTTNNGPLRHGETLTGTSVGGTGNTAFGDSFSHDGGLLTTIFVNEGATAGSGSGTLIGGTSATEFAVNARGANKCIGFTPDSDLNTQKAVTIDIFTDGKAIRAKGCMGNVEFEFNHGDAVVARFTMRGIVQAGGYLDLSMPTNSYEGHKVPPTFLGTRLTLATPENAPADLNRYGTGGTASFGTEGSLNQMRLSTGNEIVLPENSMDPDGVQYALVIGRTPVGSFNPQEVSSASEFDFIARFVGGQPARLKVLLGATNHTDPTTADQNTFDFMCPGILFTGMADQERDQINVWDASFRMTGGDYSTAAATESVGHDNEFVIVHR